MPRLPLHTPETTVIVRGIGDAPMYFLLAFAALWPIMLNTAAGVAQLPDSLAATRLGTNIRVILPSMIWIILVSAEMLGVDAGADPVMLGLLSFTEAQA